MTQPQNTENKPSQGSAEAQLAQDIVLSAGETSVQGMLTLVREYNSNAAFFNVVILPLMAVRAILKNSVTNCHLINGGSSVFQDS